MSSAGNYLPHYTVDDYRSWEGDWELWNGIPIAMTPSPFGPHQQLALLVARALLNAIESGNCQAVVLQETDWIVSNDTVVRPDISVLCDGVPTKHIESPPALIVEILSDSTREKDLSAKRDLYLNSGVEYYLIGAPEERTLSLATGDGFRPFTESFEAKICDSCHLEVDFSFLETLT